MRKDEAQKACEKRKDVLFYANEGKERIKGQVLAVNGLTAEVAFWRNGFLSQVKVPLEKLMKEE